MFTFWKIWHALFSCYLRVIIDPFGYFNRIFICLIYRNILPLNDAACLQKEAQKSGFSKVSHLLQYFLGKVVRDTKGFHFIRLHCLRYFSENVSKNVYNQTSRWNFFGGK